MKHTNTVRTAAVAATLLAAGLASAAPASAAVTPRTTTRITSQEQLHADILKAAAREAVVVCSSGIGIHVMGGWTPPFATPAS
jgi:hypothetical protein